MSVLVAPAAVANDLARKRRLTSAALWTERLVPALAFPAFLLLGYICLAATGLLALLPGWAELGLMILTLAASAAAAWRGLRNLRRPTAAQIDRRLQRSDQHRPLATLSDRPALPGAEAIWQVHRERALARIPALRPSPPRLGPHAAGLAGIALLALLSLLANPHGAKNLLQALAPALAPAETESRLQAWIEPPRQTGLPPIFLRAGDPTPLAVPIGAKLTVSVLGGAGRPRLRYAGRRSAFQRLDPGSYQASLTLAAPGTLVITRAGKRMAEWRLAVAADQPPAVRITGPATMADRQLKLPWQATDDYGLARVTAELRLRDRPAAAALEAVLPIGAMPRAASGGLLPDLTANPWAGLPVVIRYVAQDSAGQRGVSGDATAVLPERVFLNPLARGLILARRRLVLDPGGTDGAVKDLDGLAPAAIGHITSGEWLDLRAIVALLGQKPQTPDNAQARLWQLATAIEDSGVSDAKQQLAQARDALRDALAAPPSPAQQDKIAALTQALQQAMQRYLQAMERQSARAGQTPPQQQNGRAIDPKQLEQMARDMANAAKAGRMEEAEKQLQELDQILQNLKPSGKLAQNGQSGGEQDPALQKLLQDQSALQSHADQRLSTAADPHAGAQPDPAPQRQQDSSAQGALRQRLGDLAAKLGDKSGTVPQGLAGADKAMHDAQDALGRGDDRAARQAQQRALDGLRSGQNQMANKQNGNGPPQSANTDPLGRPLTEGGTTQDTSDTALPQQEDAARSRALRDELRRRDADRTRPPAELNYIDRLLDY